MAFLDLLRQMWAQQSPDESQATELRDKLATDPNDREAFDALAALIYEAYEEREVDDPLTDNASAPADPELVLWALAEEIGSDSRAWYPLIQLAKLTIAQDLESAVRHLETAVARDDTGQALAEAIGLLRSKEHYEAALQLGLGKWNPQEHPTAVAGELIQSAIAAGKIDEARSYLEMLDRDAPELSALLEK